MNTKRAHIFIKGRVQGVCYRAFTRDIAKALGLSGWVRNLPDGRVEAVLEGSSEVIEQAIKQCYIGPSGSRVEDIEVHLEASESDIAGFQVRYS